MVITLLYILQFLTVSLLIIQFLYTKLFELLNIFSYCINNKKGGFKQNLENVLFAMNYKVIYTFYIFLCKIGHCNNIL